MLVVSREELGPRPQTSLLQIFDRDVEADCRKLVGFRSEEIEGASRLEVDQRGQLDAGDLEGAARPSQLLGLLEHYPLIGESVVRVEKPLLVEQFGVVQGLVDCLHQRIDVVHEPLRRDRSPVGAANVDHEILHDLRALLPRDHRPVGVLPASHVAHAEVEKAPG